MRAALTDCACMLCAPGKSTPGTSIGDAMLEIVARHFEAISKTRPRYEMRGEDVAREIRALKGSR